MGITPGARAFLSKIHDGPSLGAGGTIAAVTAPSDGLMRASFSFSADTVLQVEVNDGSTSITTTLNNGVAFGGGKLHVFELDAVEDETYTFKVVSAVDVNRFVASLVAGQ